MGKLHSTARWQELRADHLRRRPLCVMCAKRGHVVPATVCDHIVPHRNDPVLFWDTANLQSLCAPCHDRDKQRVERGGTPRQDIGADGWPVGRQ